MMIIHWFGKWLDYTFYCLSVLLILIFLKEVYHLMEAIEDHAFDV